MLSKDTKVASFLTLVKTAAKKVKPELQLSADDIKFLTELSKELGDAAKTTEVDKAAFPLFTKFILAWPVESMFGVMGLFRLVILRHNTADTCISSGSLSPSITPLLDRLLFLTHGKEEGVEKKEEKIAARDAVDDSSIPWSVRVMALSSLCNFFHAPQVGALLAADPRVLKAGVVCLNASKDAVRTMGGHLLYNCSLFMKPSVSDDGDDPVVETLLSISEQATKEIEATACLPLLQAIGQFIYTNDQRAILLSSLDFDAMAVHKRFVEASASGASGQQQRQHVLEACLDIVDMMNVSIATLAE